MAMGQQAPERPRPSWAAHAEPWAAAAAVALLLVAALALVIRPNADLLAIERNDAQRPKLAAVSEAVGAPSSPAAVAPTTPTTAPRVSPALDLAAFRRIAALPVGGDHIQAPDGRNGQGAATAEVIATESPDPASVRKELAGAGFRGAYRTLWLSRDETSAVILRLYDFGLAEGSEQFRQSVIFATRQDPSSTAVTSPEAGCASVTLVEDGQNGQPSYNDVDHICRFGSIVAVLIVATQVGAAPKADGPGLVHQLVANLQAAA